MREQQPEIAEGVASIDRIVHEPARLAILTVLASCERADFLFLERVTGLTRGNLSVQMTRLEEAGLIEIEKTIERKRTLTTASLKFDGRSALEAYWKQMESLREMARPSLRQVKAVKGGRVPGRVAPACS
jgi:DNA-binding transcriptional ArsR family regulator